MQKIDCNPGDLGVLVRAFSAEKIEVVSVRPCERFPVPISLGKNVTQINYAGNKAPKVEKGVDENGNLLMSLAPGSSMQVIFVSMNQHDELREKTKVFTSI